MNCEDFKLIVNELAGGRPVDVAARVNGLAHVAICPECAAQLNDAKRLGGALQMVATAETEEAPARVRQALLASFTQHHCASVAPAVVTPISKISKWRAVRWVGAATLAAAAVLLLALMLPSLRHVTNPTVPVTPSQNAGLNGPSSVPTTATPNQKNEIPVTPSPVNKSVVARNNLPAKRTTIAVRARTTNRAGNEAVANSTRKSGNQYFPLTYLADATAMESGTVVRIQVSRSALISLGLPMNSERTNELVKADLVLGDDGVARAIRLVEE
jgi:hypothetical protein